jgi:hypothetical protein
MTDRSPEQPSPAVGAPLADPYAGSPTPGAAGGRPPSGSSVWAPMAIASFVGMCVLGGMYFCKATAKPPDSVVTVRPSNALLTAVRDLSRLETTELHIEKVIDLNDRQNRLFGLVEANDAILLVAAGDVVIGIDLAKLEEGDVSMDAATGTARIRLPEPEILSSRLDEANTYVYTRKTDLLARRNEALETKARQEALAAIEKAGQDADVMGRARTQAERQLRGLATQLGAKQVEITWR